jgi:hypothetical protein
VDHSLRSTDLSCWELVVDFIVANATAVTDWQEGFSVL